jgi:pimeloyl-ACP methyl ester carboxylesterase
MPTNGRAGCEHGLWVRRHGPADSAGTLLWVHGLGESSLCFEGVLAHPGLADWSHVTVDLIGYGRAERAEEPLALGEHAALLAGHLGRSVPERPVVLVGHSMGGVVGTMVCEAGGAEAIDAFVNVEGNVTPGDCTFSATTTATPRDSFARETFPAIVARTFERGASDAALRTYWASLRLCDPRAFWRNGRELVELSAAGELAGRFAGLSLPKLYIAGAPGGAAIDSLRLLRDADIEPALLSPAGHWPFVDLPTDFVAVVAEFLGAL